MSYNPSRLFVVAAPNYSYRVTINETLPVLLSSGYFSGVPENSIIKVRQGGGANSPVQDLQVDQYTLVVDATGTATVANSGEGSTATSPSAVSNLALPTPTVTGGLLTWTLPSNGGSAITSQRIERKLTSDSTWTVLTDVLTGSATSYTDTTASASNQYDYRHRSTNAVGNSAYSNVVTITTTSSVTVPSAVSNLALPTPTATGGQLTWTLPNNGGAAITAQRIERSLAGANNWTTLSSSIAGSATTYTDSTANAGTAYDYRHRSTNSVGNSAYSNVVTVTTVEALTLYAEFATDTNLAVTNFSDTFVAADVSGGRIQKTWAFNRETPARRATKVRFTTTGTLPAPLQLNTDYYLSQESGALVVYPVAPELSPNNDTPLFPTNDTMLPADYYRYQRGAISLTDGGTGTHTCTAQTMVHEWKDKTGNLAQFARSTSNLNELPLRGNVGGFPSIYFEGFLSRDPNFSHSESEGKSLTLDMLGANTKLAMAQSMCDKRFIYSISVVQLQDNAPAPQVGSLVMQPSAFNTTTGVITRTSHLLTPTGFPVVIRNWGGSVPAGFTNGTTYFARSLSSTTFALYPTRADAVADTNRIIPTTQGSGDIVIHTPADARLAQERSFIYTIDEPVGAAQHLIAPSYTEETGHGEISRIAADVTFGWVNANGEVREVLRNDVNLNGRAIPVRLMMAEGATIPTGLVNKTQTYWAVRVGNATGANRARLFSSQAAAQAWIDAGQPSAVASGQVVPTANFEGLVEWALVNNQVIMRNTTELPSSDFIPKNQIIVHAVLLDTNNPSGTVTTQLYSSGINGSITNIHNAVAYTARAKGVYPVGSARTNQNIVLANAAQPHRAGHLHLFEFMFGSSNTDPTAAMVAKINELKAKYGIA